MQKPNKIITHVAFSQFEFYLVGVITAFFRNTGPILIKILVYLALTLIKDKKTSKPL